ncbi:hypothetical protein BD626DRAFT_476233 [Schizophyllum amplum]|uniref:Actin cortical patch SUR7/pH-response regulator pali n=1 Tax=Schizophyllum amplum TaxID=97359 RepID=A0A550CZ53_9AGAR|nr:hypothetical protein BD626DRAFT_476233 [Auriculariopsis ampla]
MRKISYVLTFFIATAVLVLNVFSARQTNWIVTKDREHTNAHVSVRYGLDKRCERQVIFVPIDPDPADPSKNKGRLAYTDYVCRKFPTRVTDSCETDNAGFCAAWTSAGYLAELAIGFGCITLFAILVGASSGSRRRRVWRAVSGLILLQAALEIIVFSIITHELRTTAYPAFANGGFGGAYYIHVASWIAGIVLGGAVITTGISAEKGHKWAAGNRAYRPIEG